MKRINTLLTLSVIAILFCAGCGKRTKQPKLSNQELQTQLFDKIEKMRASGQTNEMIEVMSKALKNDAYVAIKSNILCQLQETFLRSNHPDSAENIFFETLKSDPDVASAVAGVIPNYYIANSNYVALDKLAAKIIQESDVSTILENAYGWRVLAGIKTENYDRVKLLIPEIMDKLNEASGRRFLNKVAQATLKEKQFDITSNVMDTIKTHAGEKKQYIYLLSQLNIDSLITKDNWSKVEQEFKNLAKTLPDSEVLFAYKKITHKAITLKNFELIDRISEFVLTAKKDLPTTFSNAVNMWTSSATLQGEIDLLPQRLNKLTTYGVLNQQIAQMFARYFYDIVKENNQEAIVSMNDIGCRLAAEIKDEKLTDTMKIMLLDGAFLTEDYDKALALIKDGIPNKDQEWIDQSTVKIKAHKALKEGKTQEAVKYFREFMNYIKQGKDEPQTDPSTGIAYSKEMILGFNAKRIGNILKSANDDKAAKQAYKESLDYYKQALDKLDNERSKAKVKEEMAKINL